MSRARGAHGLGYVVAIDGLRAVAVLSVLIFHLRDRLLPGGFVGVDIFFVISGFVVTGSLMSSRFDRISDLLLYFYARRLARIMPALIVMLLVTTVFSVLFIPSAWLSNANEAVGKAAFFGISNIELALQNDSYFAPRAAFNPFLHTWSLGVEEQFYIAFPFLLFWHQKRSAQGKSDRLTLGAIATLTVVSLAICGALTGDHWRYAYYTIPARFWELCAGMLLCLSIDGWRPRLARASPAAVNAFAAISAALVAVSFVLPASGLFPFPLALIPVTGTAGLIATACARPASAPARLLAARPAVWIGKLSYSLYLWHWPVFVLFRWTAGLESLPQMAIAVGVTFLLATLSLHVVERPILRVAGRSVAGPLVTIGTAVALIVGLQASASWLFDRQPLYSLSVTAQEAQWFPGEHTPLDPRYVHCAISLASTRLGQGHVYTWTPSGCRSEHPGRRLIVVGDSHAIAYTPMLRQFAADTGIEVQAIAAQGCPFLSLVTAMSASAECRDYDDVVRTRLRAELYPGDVLFLPALRVPRLGDQWGDIGTEGAPASQHVAQVDRAAMLAESRHVLDELRRTGAHIVFEAPKPIFRSPPFRCSDWFNRANPVCAPGLTAERSQILALRASVVADMRAFAESRSDVGVWDPLPILCPGKTCTAGTPRTPLYFDGDHPSAYANRRLYPDFRNHIGAAFGRCCRPDDRSSSPAPR